MDDLRALLGGFQPGSFPMWGTFVLLLGTIAKLWFQSRKMRIDENVDGRAGYGDVIRTLREEVSRLSADHRLCEDRLKAIEAQLEGVHKQLVAQASVMAVNLGASATITRAAEAATAAINRGGQK